MLRGLFASLGIDKAPERVQLDHKQLGFSLREAVFQRAAARFVRPGSKLAIDEPLLQVLYPEFVRQQLELQHPYRALDVLQNAEDQIETDLFVHGRDLFSRHVEVVLYDRTTLRFESSWETERLWRFGFSKERRSDCTQ
ncbi:IS1634 family transposase, partial [Myxococcota bacterium]